MLSLLVQVLIVCFPGQIASLTGGETGNESPLAVEMYELRFVKVRKPLTLFLNLQWSIRRYRILYCNSFRHCLLRSRYLNGIRWKGLSNCHLRGLHSRRIRT